MTCIILTRNPQQIRELRYPEPLQLPCIVPFLLVENRVSNGVCVTFAVKYLSSSSGLSFFLGARFSTLRTRCVGLFFFIIYFTPGNFAYLTSTMTGY